MKINIVLAERVMELSEIEDKLIKLKRFITNWTNVAILSIGLFTLKIAAEQLFLLWRNNV